MKKILITGRNGYVASNLIRNLNKNHYRITCISRNSNDINLYDYDNIKKAIKNSDVIVHLAAITNPFDRNIWKINVNYTKFIVNEAKKFNKKFIYLSTQNVLFGKDSYSKTKKEAEKVVKTLNNYAILRPTIIYGKDENRYIGRLINIIKNSYFVPIISDGEYKLQPIYIDDLVKIIKNCINKKINGVFLIPGKTIISYNELINLITKKLKLKRVKIHIPNWFIRPFAYLFQIFLKNPPVTSVQLNNIKINQAYETKQIEKLFNINLKTINQGLDEIIK